MGLIDQSGPRALKGRRCRGPRCHNESINDPSFNLNSLVPKVRFATEHPPKVPRTVRSSQQNWPNMASTEDQPVDKRDVLDILDAEGKEFEKASRAPRRR